MSGSPRGPDRRVGYAAAMGVFASAAAAVVAAARHADGVPERYAGRDLVLGALATHEVARIVAKDGVTSPLRAPFTVFRGEAGSAEIDEEPRDGHRHTIGELLTCPC